jgi:uncharacterized protein
VSARRALLALVTALWILPAATLAADFQVPPTPSHFVTDNAGALSDTTRAQVENELQAYQRATGHQVIVWIGKSTGDVPLETWTGETADKWKVGRKGHDDGAVLFLFMADRKMRIEVGYGLESVLPDADAYRIIQDVIRPKMRGGDTDGAVSSGVAAMLKTITPAYAAVTAPPDDTSDNTSAHDVMFGLFAMLFLGFGVLVFVMSIVRSIRYGYLVMREGSAAAKRDMKQSHFWGGGFIGGMTSGGGGGGGGGFSAGGGGFGGGGASGGW